MTNILLTFSPHLDILTFSLSTLQSMNICDGHLAKYLDRGYLGEGLPLPFLLIPQIGLIYLSGSHFIDIQSILDLLIQFIFTAIWF